MLKNMSSLGKALNKAEQKEVNGGRRPKELCEVVDGVIYTCPFPLRCQLNPGGTYDCV